MPPEHTGPGRSLEQRLSTTPRHLDQPAVPTPGRSKSPAAPTAGSAAVTRATQSHGDHRHNDSSPYVHALPCTSRPHRRFLAHLRPPHPHNSRLHLRHHQVRFRPSLRHPPPCPAGDPRPKTPHNATAHHRNRPYRPQPQSSIAPHPRPDPVHCLHHRPVHRQDPNRNEPTAGPAPPLTPDSVHNRHPRTPHYPQPQPHSKMRLPPTPIQQPRKDPT